MGDRLLLTQLVRNLTLNAAQHNVEGGHIWVSTGEHFDVDGRRMSSFDVENTGADLCETNLGDLFAPFNRGRNSRIMEHDMSSRTIGNHGLGLSIAKEIVTLHDGSIRLQARDGEDSAFPCTSRYRDKSGTLFATKDRGAVSQNKSVKHSPSAFG